MRHHADTHRHEQQRQVRQQEVCHRADALLHRGPAQRRKQQQQSDDRARPGQREATRQQLAGGLQDQQQRESLQRGH